jgi:hypothetical protein
MMLLLQLVGGAGEHALILASETATPKTLRYSIIFATGVSIDGQNAEARLLWPAGDRIRPKTAGVGILEISCY